MLDAKIIEKLKMHKARSIQQLDAMKQQNQQLQKKVKKNKGAHYDAWSTQLDFNGKLREIEYLKEDKRKLHVRVAELVQKLDGAAAKEMKSTVLEPAQPNDLLTQEKVDGFFNRCKQHGAPVDSSEENQ